MEYIVKFQWDDDASVWVATSDDIPGLVLESGSFDVLSGMGSIYFSATYPKPFLKSI